MLTPALGCFKKKMKKKSFFIIIFIYCISFVYADNLIIKELHISDESPYLSEKMYSSIGEVIYLSLKIPNSIILNSTVFEEKISGEKWNKKIGELVTICQLSSMQLNIPEELYTNNYNKKFFYNHTKKRLKNFDTMKIDEVNYFEFYIFDDNLCCIINFFTDAVEYQEEEKQFLNIIQSLNFPYSRIGIMNDSKVRIRSTPSLNSNI